MTNQCVICGAEIPEGTQVCYSCIKKNFGSDEWQAGYNAAKEEDEKEFCDLRNEIIKWEKAYNFLVMEVNQQVENKKYYKVGELICKLFDELNN